MNPVWDDGLRPEPVRVGLLGWGLVVLRVIPLLFVLLAGLVATLILRPFEKALFNLSRPVTPFITEAVCTASLAILGIPLKRTGKRMSQRGAVVANHSSWLDIFVLNARKRIYFVAKAEIATWPGISWLAKATGTVFIERDRKRATEQVALFTQRLGAGHRLLFFPEGTSTDARRVLPFKPTLFAAFFSEGLRDWLHIQPVTVIYRAPKGRDKRFYGWWGDMEMGPHLLMVLAQPRQGEVEIIYHEPVKVSEFASRKELASYCEETIRAPIDFEVAQDAAAL